MPRRTGTEHNELKIHDNISNSDIILYYRDPDTAERSGYQNESLQRRRSRIVFRTAEARLKYGAKILTGFRSGDFERKIDGRWVPMASDPQSEHYFEDWKAHLVKHAGDLIMLLAAHVFDAPAEVEEPDDADDIPGEDAEKN